MKASGINIFLLWSSLCTSHQYEPAWKCYFVLGATPKANSYIYWFCQEDCKMIFCGGSTNEDGFSVKKKHTYNVNKI